MVKLITTPTNNHLYTLTNSEIVCHPFEARDDEFTLVTFYHSLHGQRQDFSVRFWFSDEPNGDPLPTIPTILHNIRPLGRPYRFAVYADRADVTVEEAAWDVPFTDAQFDVTVTRRADRRTVPDHLTLVTGLDGTYYLNVQNLVASDNGYFLDIVRTPLVDS